MPTLSNAHFNKNEIKIDKSWIKFNFKLDHFFYFEKKRSYIIFYNKLLFKVDEKKVFFNQ